jgi:hypothetical protein
VLPPSGHKEETLNKFAENEEIQIKGKKTGRTRIRIWKEETGKEKQLNN